MNDTVSFGYEDVAPAEKTARVGEVFKNVAGKYDLMNDAMSGGIGMAFIGCSAVLTQTIVSDPVAMVSSPFVRTHRYCIVFSLLATTVMHTSNSSSTRKATALQAQRPVST